MSLDIKLSSYRDGVKRGCKALHSVAKSAHKPGMIHLYDAVLALEDRCKRLEDAADSQFRAMGEDLEWTQYWKVLGLNPFATARSPLVPRVEETTSNIRTRSTEEQDQDTTTERERLVTLAPLKDLHELVMPVWMNEAYGDFCELQGMAYHKACCTPVLFKFPDAANLADLECSALIIPERMEGTEFYRPLFVTKDMVDLIERTGSLTEIREVYVAMSTPQPRGRRQVIPLAIAGGAMFTQAVNSVLGWFGYSTTTTKDVKHINANQKHIKQVETHVASAEKFASKIRAEAHDVANKEQMIERFLHISTSLQGVFEHYELLMQGLSMLFHVKHLSPLLVDRVQIMKMVRELMADETERGNLILINPLDVWRCELSYVVTRTMDVVVMVHIPVGKADSYRNLYEYIPTPLAFSDSSKHFFPNPRNTYLVVDKDSARPRSMSTAELGECDSVGTATRYCPAATFQLNESPPTCLTALHQGDTTGVLAMCPVSLVNEKYVHVASLGFGAYSVYSKNEVKARVLCGEDSINQLAIKGLMKLKIRKDCRVVGDQFVLEPMVDFTSLSQVMDEVPIVFAPDQNFTLAIDWGAENGIIKTVKGPGGATMADVARSWDDSLLDESEKWTFAMWVGVAFAILVAVLCICCGSKECYNVYERRVERSRLAETIRSQMMELAPLNQSATAPTD